MTLSIKKMFRQALRNDNVIDTREARDIAKNIEAGGVTAKEKKKLTKLLNSIKFADKFEPGAKNPLEKLLGKPGPAPAPGPNPGPSTNPLTELQQALQNLLATTTAAASQPVPQPLQDQFMSLVKQVQTQADLQKLKDLVASIPPGAAQDSLQALLPPG